MTGVNKVILVGNLGKDPEMRYLENGRTRASFTLATNDSYKNKEGERVTTTEWHNVVVWSPLAKVAEQYLQKGKQVYIEGRISNRSYVDKDGQNKYISEIVAQNLVLLGGGKVDASEPSLTQNGDAANTTEENASDGLPF